MSDSIQIGAFNKVNIQRTFEFSKKTQKQGGISNISILLKNSLSAMCVIQRQSTYSSRLYLYINLDYLIPRKHVYKSVFKDGAHKSGLQFLSDE